MGIVWEVPISLKNVVLNSERHFWSVVLLSWQKTVKIDRFCSKQIRKLVIRSEGEFWHSGVQSQGVLQTMTSSSALIVTDQSIDWPEWINTRVKIELCTIPCMEPSQKPNKINVVHDRTFHSKLIKLTEVQKWRSCVEPNPCVMHDLTKFCYSLMRTPISQPCKHSSQQSNGRNCGYDRDNKPVM